MDVINITAVYLAAVNAAGFALMGIDKGRARRQDWRISEATLFLVALIGGSIGSLIGMYVFHHKTRHRSFVFGIPAILAAQVLAVILLITSPIHFELL